MEAPKNRTGKGPQVAPSGDPKPSRSGRRRRRRRRPSRSQERGQGSSPSGDARSDGAPGRSTGSTGGRKTTRGAKNEPAAAAPRDDAKREKPTPAAKPPLSEGVPVEDGVLVFRRRQAGPCSRFVLKECFD